MVLQKTPDSETHLWEGLVFNPLHGAINQHLRYQWFIKIDENSQTGELSSSSVVGLQVPRKPRQSNPGHHHTMVRLCWIE
ncbi:hypothetical protein V6Z12_A06G062500 [Gossypium hirsutum]